MLHLKNRVENILLFDKHPEVPRQLSQMHLMCEKVLQSNVKEKWIPDNNNWYCLRTVVENNFVILSHLTKRTIPNASTNNPVGDLFGPTILHLAHISRQKDGYIHLSSFPSPNQQRLLINIGNKESSATLTRMFNYPRLGMYSVNLPTTFPADPKFISQINPVLDLLKVFNK